MNREEVQAIYDRADRLHHQAYAAKDAALLSQAWDMTDEALVEQSKLSEADQTWLRQRAAVALAEGFLRALCPSKGKPEL